MHEINSNPETIDNDYASVQSHLVFAVYDTKAEAFGAPFVVKTKGIAIREFEQVVNNPEHPYSKNPDDFSLFHIADYYEARGHIDPLVAPQSLGTARDFVRQQDLPFDN